MVRRSENRTEKNAQQNNHHGKHKTIAVIMAVFLVLIAAAGLYILNAEGKINIAFLNQITNSGNEISQQATPQPAEYTEELTAEPEITPDSTPEPTKEVFIPDIGELQALPA